MGNAESWGFDPLVCTTITTTRKVFSVLLSVFTKGHNLNGQGWAGIACACTGILGELEEKYSKSKEATKKKTDGDKKKDDKKKGDENKKNGTNDENKKNGQKGDSPSKRKEDNKKSK